MVLTIVSISCEKNDLSYDVSESDAILHFDSMKEMRIEASKLLKLSIEEKEQWTKEKGFISFGIEADKFYESIDPEEFENIIEIKSYVDNSKYLEIVEGEKGELYVETKNSNSPFRYFMNKDGVFSVGDKAIRLLCNQMVIGCIDNIERLKQYDDITIFDALEEFEVIMPENSLTKSISASCPLEVDEDEQVLHTDGKWYRVRLQAWNEDNYSSWHRENTAETYYQVTSYKKTLGVWFKYTNNITYDLYIRSRFVNGFGNWENHIFNTSGTDNTKVVEDYEITATANYNMNTQIYFYEIDAEAYVPETSSDKTTVLCN